MEDEPCAVDDIRNGKQAFRWHLHRIPTGATCQVSWISLRGLVKNGPETDPVVEHVAHPGLARGELCDDDGPGPGREPADQPDGYLRVLSVRDRARRVLTR
jgi:hypothetical protein